ncbi:MAG: ribosome small subunit-dependent GTPase A [Spirochaetaceae bacterium 4572_59]|nr:MAG: ribosome small subunit-dependent GTPase A [Spirochaetaceae bacterium 4572_59]
MKGLVLWGINNIYLVKGIDDGNERECRIKGKKLISHKKFYNPISAGDQVDFEDIPGEPDKAIITGRDDRFNYFARYNKKGRALQTLAVNMDRLYCIVSPELPPFRPRFIDRALIMAEQGHLEISIILNKCDQNIEDSVRSRLSYFESLHIPVYSVSAETGEGVDALLEEIKGKIVGFAGQSGVGKSTLLNRLIPNAEQTTAEVSRKMCRGKHTTNFAVMIPHEFGSGYIIDTPGIRELLLWGIDSSDLDHWFIDFQPLIGSCNFNGCHHLHEPGCAIKDAVQSGVINEDRYESYVRMFAELKENERQY